LKPYIKIKRITLKEKQIMGKMNIYRITFSHTAPKDREEGIKGYLLAENDEQVYNYIDKTYNYGCWKDNDDDYNLIGIETFKQNMLRIKGEQNDENYDYRDAYYGITLYGWELVKENAEGDYTEMIDLGIISNCI